MGTVSTIPPALSAEVWQRIRSGDNASLFAVITLEGGNDDDIGATEDRESDDVGSDAIDRDSAKRDVAAIAALNAALPDTDPRKLTWAHVDALRKPVHDDDCDMCTTLSDYSPSCSCDATERNAALAALLESLLRPRS